MKSLLLFLAPATTFAASINRPRDALAPAASLPDGWQYANCRVDGLNPRSLSLAAYSDSGMTGESCIAFCSAKGYNVAGTEYSHECYCGTVLPAVAEESDCNMPCSGDSTEVCGGPARLTVYQNVAQGAPSVNPGTNGWVSYGCVADSVSDRTLANWAATEGPMTVAGCISACQAGGYTFGGVEYAQECWCGNGASLKPTSDPAQCYMPCVGNHNEICGGPNALNVYSAPVTNPPTDPSCLAVRSDGYGLIQNGGFESAFDGWIPNVVEGEFQPGLDTQHPYEGCNAASVTPVSAPDASDRIIQISQSINNLVTGSHYTFTGFQGRLPESLNDPSPVIAVTIGSQYLGQVIACAGTGCDISRANGAQYTEHIIPFTYTDIETSATLQFTIKYTNRDPQKGNPTLLFDGFNLKQDDVEQDAT